MKQNLLTEFSSADISIIVTLSLLINFQRSMDRFTDQFSGLVKEFQHQHHIVH